MTHMLQFVCLWSNFKWVNNAFFEFTNLLVFNHIVIVTGQNKNLWIGSNYHKNPKKDTWKFAVIILKFFPYSNESKCRRNGKPCRPWLDCSTRSTLFAQAYLSKNLGSLR